MSHSNSSLNCFADCMKMYEHRYILKTPSCKPESLDLKFGTMAHEVLYKAGLAKDIGEHDLDFIPDEIMYPDLKCHFNINSWNNYFTAVINEVSKIEDKLALECINDYAPTEIHRELKLELTAKEFEEITGCKNISQPFVGIIDLLIVTKDKAIIIDYKFSSNRKTQDDFDMNSQLPLYAAMVHYKFDIPLHNIKYGYIDIPKTSLDAPTILSNGLLSRSKSQNVSQELYAKAVKAIHGDDPFYNCEPGGYYYDAWCNMVFNKPAYLSIQYLDESVYGGVLNDLGEAAQMIDFMIKNKMPFCKKYNSHNCKKCDYVKSCKPWTEV